MLNSVSVVVPTYARAATLVSSIEAIARCTPPAGGFEIIVIDDGSPIDVTSLLAAHRLQVTVIRQENQGPAAARNAGLDAASNEVIAFTDDDTVVSADWLVDLLAGFDDAAVAGVGGRIEPVQRGYMADFVQLERLVDHGLAADGTVRYLVTANASFRRSALSAVGGFDTGFRAAAGEDVDLSARLVEAGWRLRVVDRALVRHDHRTTLRDLVRTSRSHGRSSARLERDHPWVTNLERSRAPVRHLSDRYTRYRRASVGRARSCSYLCLHLVKSAVILAAARQETMRLRR